MLMLILSINVYAEEALLEFKGAIVEPTTTLAIDLVENNRNKNMKNNKIMMSEVDRVDVNKVNLKKLVADYAEQGLKLELHDISANQYSIHVEYK